ncbi:MAG TPA: hypothetical protein VJQ59_02045, partial [Candidatus Sulfotelmatobacter sp.]|nr:hypothetical protein [Candidatus Sulfotelmatobacter sp.]
LEIAVREDVSLGAFQAVVRKELGITEEAWISWRVPLAVEKQLEAAVKKIARIFSIDLAEEPNRRVLCLEYIAGLVDGLPEDTLRVAITGE